MGWQKKIEKLSTSELTKIQGLVDSELKRRKEKDDELPPIRLKHPPSYVQERIKCGKKTCKCTSGNKEDLHGPYWMEIRRIKGKIKSKYIGKKLKIGCNKSNQFIGAVFEFENYGVMEIVGFIDNGDLSVRGSKDGLWEIKKKDKVYQQLMKYRNLLIKDSL